MISERKLAAIRYLWTTATCCSMQQNSTDENLSLFCHEKLLISGVENSDLTPLIAKHQLQLQPQQPLMTLADAPSAGRTPEAL